MKSNDHYAFIMSEEFRLTHVMDEKSPGLASNCQSFYEYHPLCIRHSSRCDYVHLWLSVTSGDPQCFSNSHFPFLWKAKTNEDKNQIVFSKELFDLCMSGYPAALSDVSGACL